MHPSPRVGAFQNGKINRADRVIDDVHPQRTPLLMVADFLTAITSVQHIHDVVASKDESLLEELLRDEAEELREEFGDNMTPDELEEFNEVLNDKRDQFRQFLISDKPASLEPGSTMFAVQRIIDRDDLEVELHLAFNIGYRHTVWDAYRTLVQEHISAECLQLLRHLEARPFRGDEVEFDGQIYGWLISSEIGILHDALNEIAGADLAAGAPEGPQIEKFHSDLIDALDQLRTRGLDCINFAC